MYEKENIVCICGVYVREFVCEGGLGPMRVSAVY